MMIGCNNRIKQIVRNSLRDSGWDDRWSFITLKPLTLILMR